MASKSLRPNHSIVPVNNQNSDAMSALKVTIRLPLEYGWYEQVRLNVVESGSFNMLDNYQGFYLQHKFNDSDYAVFESEITLETRALYYYYFTYKCNGQITVLNKENVGGNTPFKLAVNFSSPDWAKGAIMYHIFVDRFYRGNPEKPPQMPGRTINDWDSKPVLGPNPNANGDWNVDYYGGDLLGIVDKLDYISSLGTDIIYLSPIHWAQSNHGYDTVDYEKIDPYMGTHKELKLLCDECHKRGIHVIVDGVYNHVGNKSKYFDEFLDHEISEDGKAGAYNHPDTSPYKSFFKKFWHNGQTLFSYWWGFKTLPECDTNSPEWQNYITGIGGIIDQLFACGIDGIRLDVADELSDPMIEKIKEAIVRNKSDGFLFGEVWKNPMRMGRGYISSGKGMHSVMNYMPIDAFIRYYKYQDCWKLEQKLNEVFEEYPTDSILTLMNFTSTHDISRAIELFGFNEFTINGEWAWDMYHNNASDFVKNHVLSHEQYEYGKKILKSYIVALAFLPGIFSIFYGDEVGLGGLHNLANRGSFPWGKEDTDLLDYFRRMLKARKSNTFLKYAECKVIEISKERFMYERFLGNNRILVIASRTHYETETNIPSEYSVSGVVFRSNEYYPLGKLEPYGTLVLKVTKKQS